MNFSNMKLGTLVMGAISAVISGIDTFRHAEQSFGNRLLGYHS